MKRQEQQPGKKLMNHRREDAKDSGGKVERVDVSPFGTEGIFIDVEIPENVDDK